MIGTSGPSISTTALSTSSPRSAASRCSAVEHSGPLASPRTVANSVAVTARTSARISRSIEPSAAHALENDAGIVVGRIQGERDGQTGMDADAGDGNLVA